MSIIEDLVGIAKRSLPITKAGEIQLSDETLMELTRDQLKGLSMDQKLRRSALYRRLEEQKAEEKIKLRAALTWAQASGVQFHHADMTTFAYRNQIISGTNGGAPKMGTMVEIATATCHIKDRYSKWRGSAYAAQRFQAGMTITLKAPREFPTGRDFIEGMGLLVKDCWGLEE